MAGTGARSRVARLLGGLLLGLTAACCPDSPADLEDEDPDVRREALACQAEDPEDPTALAHAAAAHLSPAAEPDPSVRAAAARVLLHLHRTRATARPPGEDSVRSVTSALPGPGDGQAGGDDVPAGDGHWLVRVQAVATLRGLLGADAAPTLRAALADPERDVRLAAARELGLSGDDSAATTQALIDALRDQAPEVRYHARRALQALHGVDQGLLPAAWENWERQRQERLRRSATPSEEEDEPEPEQESEPEPEQESEPAPTGPGDEPR